ncbi:hypothetical protein Tco_1137412 [Tanacetum coccineum]
MKGYRNPHDPDVSDAVLEFFETILAGDLEMQMRVTNVEMPNNMAQEWIVECDGDEEVKVQDQEAQWEVIGEAMEADEYLQPRQSSRTTSKTTQRELFDEEFESGSEEVVYEEGEYESDGVKIWV